MSGRRQGCSVFPPGELTRLLVPHAARAPRVLWPPPHVERDELCPRTRSTSTAHLAAAAEQEEKRKWRGSARPRRQCCVLLGAPSDRELRFGLLRSSPTRLPLPHQTPPPFIYTLALSPESKPLHRRKEVNRTSKHPGFTN
ncbi:hypothetical protein NDU88_002940 [Pleurodeles waltl]|uniref:Uncharacterized protein n=1 Tax=Pleurodeles waltl TaxID=8319 RepID=A0AAV7M3Y4_PLEWA|nr:hypothetical protein NDU88_002940 [Pleurodeles waltl]